MALSRPSLIPKSVSLLDPVTQKMIDRMDARLRADYEARIESINALITARLEAMDKATVVLATYMERAPQYIEHEVGRLQALLDEKLHGVDTISKESIESTNQLISRLEIAVAASVMGARLEASTANDTLQRLLEAAMAASIKLSDVRFAGQEVAITKTETAILAAKTSADSAIRMANESASAALMEVNAKSIMRHEAAISATTATELKLGERMVALQQLIDLRARSNEIAVDKATEANEKRFESVNEFRTTLSDQARDFVTMPVLLARTAQQDAQIVGIERQLRASAETTHAALSALASRLDRGEAGNVGMRQANDDRHSTTNNTIGMIGGVVGVFGFIAALTFSMLNYHTNSTTPMPATENSRRIDDLSQRLDSLSSRSRPP